MGADYRANHREDLEKAGARTIARRMPMKGSGDPLLWCRDFHISQK